MSRPSIDEVIEGFIGQKITLRIEGSVACLELPVIVTSIERVPGTLLSVKGHFVSSGVPKWTDTGDCTCLAKPGALCPVCHKDQR